MCLRARKHVQYHGLLVWAIVGCVIGDDRQLDHKYSQILFNPATRG